MIKKSRNRKGRPECLSPGGKQNTDFREYDESVFCRTVSRRRGRSARVAKIK